jgi:pimeloyl-ACP methyl ester carboxylesterase
VSKLVILNAPHARIYFRKMWRSIQMFRSAYVIFFSIPGLAERVLAAADFQAIRLMFKRLVGRSGTFSEQDIQEYVRALATPGALTAGLNFYRANFLSRDAVQAAQSAQIDAETLVIWGERDPALGTNLLEGLEAVAPHLRIHRIPDAGHFVQNEAPDEVNRVMVEFLRGGGWRP